MSEPKVREEDPILRDAREQRQQELKLAEIAAETERVRLRYEDERKSQRRFFLGWVLAVLAAITVLAGLIGAMMWNAQNDDNNVRRERQQQQQQEQEAAQLCIREGNIWIEGNCVLSGEERP